MIIPLVQVAARFALTPMRNVLHIGGHYGEEFDDYRANRVERMTFVEPQLDCFCEMQRRIGGRGGVRLFHTALGAKPGYAMMHVETANAGQSSSLLPPALHATQYPQIVFHDRELVTVMRTDDLFAGDAFDFIAIDVQGFELEVFRGATTTLQTVQAISAEVNREELYEGCARIGDLDTFLGDHGFERKLTEWCGDTWGEAIYTRVRP